MQISETEWKKVQELFDSKTQQIKNLEKQVEKLTKSDDLLYSYEQDNVTLRSTIKHNEQKINQLNDELTKNKNTTRLLCEKLTELIKVAEVNDLLRTKQTKQIKQIKAVDLLA